MCTVDSDIRSATVQEETHCFLSRARLVIFVCALVVVVFVGHCCFVDDDDDDDDDNVFNNWLYSLHTSLPC